MTKSTWQHHCTKRKDLISTWLDVCPFCNAGRGLPIINPHLIDELLLKIARKEKANHDKQI